MLSAYPLPASQAKPKPQAEPYPSPSPSTKVVVACWDLHRRRHRQPSRHSRCLLIADLIFIWINNIRTIIAVPIDTDIIGARIGAAFNSANRVAKTITIGIDIPSGSIGTIVYGSVAIIVLFVTDFCSIWVGV